MCHRHVVNALKNKKDCSCCCCCCYHNHHSSECRITNYLIIFCLHFSLEWKKGNRKKRAKDYKLSTVSCCVHIWAIYPTHSPHGNSVRQCVYPTNRREIKYLSAKYSLLLSDGARPQSV